MQRNDRIEPKVAIIIVAGGSGCRAGGSVPKQFQFLGQLPMLGHTINSFAGALPLAELVVVLAADRVEYWRNLASRFNISKHRVVEGGAERFDSVRCGLAALSDEVEIIGVHDGARPLCSLSMIRRCVDSAIANGSAIPTVALSDSLRELTSEHGESRSLPRASYRAVQTPQVFDAVTLRRAYRAPYDSSFTDDASVVESMGERVWMCEGERVNIKITTAEDLTFARAMMAEAAEAEAQQLKQQQQ